MDVTATPDLAELGSSTAITVCGMSGLAGSVAGFLITMALSGLTGVRAFIPIFIVAVSSKLSEDFPLCLSEEGAWLNSWVSIVCIGILMVIELVCDCFPAVDEIMDVIMDVVKPLVAVVLALAPMVGDDFGSQLVAAVPSFCLSLIVALVKQGVTAAVDVASVGACAPLRSISEDLFVVTATVLSLVFVFAAAAVVFLWFLAVAIFVFYVCRKLIKRKRTCKPGHGDTDESDSLTSESGQSQP